MENVSETTNDATTPLTKFSKGEIIMRDANMPLQYHNNCITADTNIQIKDPAILIDSDGVLLKYGNYNDVESYYKTKAYKLESFGIQLTLIHFDQTQYTLDEICSIFNFALNTHTNELCNLLHSKDKQETKLWLNKIQNWGF